MTIHYAVRHAQPSELAQARALILRVLDEDLGYGYVPDWHWDLDDLRGVYLDNPRHALLVAVDGSGTVIGTTAIRAGGPQSPPHPPWLAARYAPSRTAQLYHVYIARDYRRRGVARALVEAARQWVVEEGGYDVAYLHTDARVPGDVEFWQAMPTIETYDGRGQDEYSKAVHFELPLSHVADAQEASETR